MEKVVEERLKRRSWALNKAKEFAECVKEIFSNITLVILFGSYARGDFNMWSDIDILIVVDGGLPDRPTERIDMVTPCIVRTKAPIEPLIITKEELEKLKKKRNPAIMDAINNGITIFGQQIA